MKVLHKLKPLVLVERQLLFGIGRDHRIMCSSVHRWRLPSSREATASCILALRIAREHTMTADAEDIGMTLSIPVAEGARTDHAGKACLR
jgi:hypothetical protein